MYQVKIEMLLFLKMILIYNVQFIALADPLTAVTGQSLNKITAFRACVTRVTEENVAPK
jgi:hypothetical protein